jgi:hypothetical protein
MQTFLRSLSPLSLQPCFQAARAPSRLCFSSRFYTPLHHLHTASTNSYSDLPTMPAQMSPRRNNEPQGQGQKGRAPYRKRKPAAPASRATGSIGPTQQPQRPTLDGEEKPVLIDARKLYSTSASGQEAKTFSSMDDKLDKALLEGVKKMGFE